jgi:DNA-binding beta-propeller fold protein YncE
MSPLLLDTNVVSILSPDKRQQYLYVSDGSNKKVQILDRKSLQVIGFFGGHGGHGAGQFYHLHSIATDSKGNVYAGESFGERALRWNFTSVSTSKEK